MNSEAEIIEEIDEGSVGYGVNIVPVISPYDYLIKTKPECFHIALGVEIEVPVITHDLTNIVEHFVDIIGGLLQGSGIEESPCLVNISSRRKKNIPQSVGVVACKEVEAVQAVIVKPFQYLTEHRTTAVDSSDKLICDTNPESTT